MSSPSDFLKVSSKQWSSLPLSFRELSRSFAPSLAAKMEYSQTSSKENLMVFKYSSRRIGNLIPLILLCTASACAPAPTESTPVNTQHPENVKILNDKLEVVDFLKRLKAAFDEDLGLKPDVFLEKNEH